MTPHFKGAAVCLLAALLVVPLNCGDEADCLEICSRYSECISDIDVTECTDLCEDRTEDVNVRQAADDCEACLAGDACPEAAQCFEPGTDCPLAISIAVE